MVLRTQRRCKVSDACTHNPDFPKLDLRWGPLSCCVARDGHDSERADRLMVLIQFESCLLALLFLFWEKEMAQGLLRKMVNLIGIVDM